MSPRASRAATAPSPARHRLGPPDAAASQHDSATTICTLARRRRLGLRLTYVDEEGTHVFVMRKDLISIGRGGSAHWVDVQVVTSPRVSREHCRIRRDADGRFFLQDVSTWGTSVDGAARASRSARQVGRPRRSRRAHEQRADQPARAFSWPTPSSIEFTMERSTMTRRCALLFLVALAVRPSCWLVYLGWLTRHDA